MLKRTTKPLRRRVLIEEGLAKSQAPRKHSELKEPYEMLNKTKTLTTLAR